MVDLKKDDPNVAPKLEKFKSRKKQSGRIATEESQAGLHQAIFEIIGPDAGADEIIPTEVYSSVRTLDDLHSALEEKGFKVSRAAIFYCLILANETTKMPRGM